METQEVSETVIQLAVSDRGIPVDSEMEILVDSEMVIPEVSEVVILVDSVILFRKQDLTIIISNHPNHDIITEVSEMVIPEASDQAEVSIPAAVEALEAAPAVEAV